MLQKDKPDPIDPNNQDKLDKTIEDMMHKDWNEKANKPNMDEAIEKLRLDQKEDEFREELEKYKYDNNPKFAYPRWNRRPNASGANDWAESLEDAIRGSALDVYIPDSIKREDFKKIILKGFGNKYYFSFSFGYHGEVTLEPCFEGFDVGLYINKKLAFPKKCTKIKGTSAYKKKGKLGDLRNEDFYHTLQRSEKTWDKAMENVDELTRTFRNQQRVKRMGLDKDKGLQVDQEGNMAGAARVGQPVGLTSGNPNANKAPYYKARYGSQTLQDKLSPMPEDIGT